MWALLNLRDPIIKDIPAGILKRKQIILKICMR